MNDIKNRQRKINVEDLTDEQIANLEKEIGDKIRNIVDDACGDANKILNIYGLKVLMKMEFKKLEEN